MKKLLLATAAAALLSAPAIATPYDGFYLGGNVVYSTGDANQTRYSNVGGPFVFTQNDASIDGWAVGIIAGHDWTVSGNLVIGLEGNWDFGGPSGDDAGSGGDTNEWDQTSEASLRARLGFLVSPSTLIYGTVGYSWAEYDANVLNAPTSSRSHTFDDWTYGLGVETALTASMTARFQYRHTDYSADRVTFAPAEAYDIEAGPTTDNFSLGFAFHF